MDARGQPAGGYLIWINVPRCNGVWFLCMETSYLGPSSRLYIVCMIVTYILNALSVDYTFRVVG